MPVAGNDATPRLALHWLWNEAQTDSAYTVNVERRNRLIREHGYIDMGAIAHVDARPSPNTRPLICFYSGPPRTNSFCSISAREHKLIRSLGYQEVSIEGYVAVERTAESLVLFRLSRSYGDGKDREHRFAVTSAELVRLRKQGWTYDGAKGFVNPLH